MSLTDVDLKAVQSFRGQVLAGATRQGVMQSQHGACLGAAGCELAHLTVRLAVEAAQVKGTAISLVFVDISTAISTAVRQFLFEVNTADLDWLVAQMSARRFTPEEISEVRHTTEVAAEWGTAAQHLRMFIASYAGKPWIAAAYTRKVARTRSRIGAGVPLFDIVFVMISSVITRNQGPSSLGRPGYGLRPPTPHTSTAFSNSVTPPAPLGPTSSQWSRSSMTLCTPLRGHAVTLMPKLSGSFRLLSTLTPGTVHSQRQAQQDIYHGLILWARTNPGPTSSLHTQNPNLPGPSRGHRHTAC